MKQQRKGTGKLYKSAVLLLAAALLVGGCGNTEGNPLTQVSESAKEQSGDMTYTMGRFVEQQIHLPTELFVESSIIYANGLVQIIGDYKKNMISDDLGENFQIDASIPQAFEDAIMEGNVRDVATTVEGDLLVTRYEKPERGESIGHYSRCIITMDNQELEVLGLPDETMLFYYGENGYFYGISSNCHIYQIDPETAEVTALFKTESVAGYLAVCGKYLYVSGMEFLHIYDLEKQNMAEGDTVLEEFLQNEMKNFTLGNINFLISQGPESDSIYVLTEKGLYKHVLYGSTMEQIIDGSLCSIGDISKNFRGMAALGNDVFLILFRDSLMRYTYDPDIPSMPDKTLRVYSLYEDANVKLAANAYQQGHPEIYIKYETGITNNTGVTREDALKSLSTELAAGNGPDILLMDDIPYESYSEKGILMDISELVSAGNEELFDSIIDSFRREDKLYTVPASFLLPLLTGNRDKIEDIKTLAELADLLEETRREMPEGSLISFVDEKGVLELFAKASCVAWVKEDGSLHKEAITEFLTDCKRIYDAQMSGIGETEVTLYQDFQITGANTKDIGLYGEYDIQSATSFGVCYYQPFSAGYFSGTPSALSYYTSMLRENRDTFINMPGQRQNVCIPVTLLSINNATKMKEDAQSFLQYFISSAFQSALPIGGSPINKKAYEDKQLFDLSLGRNLDNAYGVCGMRRQDDSSIIIKIGWPRPRDFKNLNSMVESLEGICICDYRVYQAVMELGEPAMTGETSIEEAADAIEKKVQLYLAE